VRNAPEAAAAFDLGDAEIQDLHPHSAGQFGRASKKQVRASDHGARCRRHGRARAEPAWRAMSNTRSRLAALGPPCAFLQRGPFEKLHQDVGRALRRDASVEHFDDAGMTDGAGGPRFVEKTPNQLRVLGKPRVQNFTAARRSSSGFSARYTSPKPPSPSSRTMR